MKRETVLKMVRLALSLVVFFIGWAVRSGSDLRSSKVYGGILIAIGLFGVAVNSIQFLKPVNKNNGNSKKK